MSARWRPALAGVLAILLSGCAYRMAAPAPLGEPLRIEIASDDARLVRVQAYLQTSVALAIENKLGWQVSPTGSAKLSLVIKREAISNTATGAQDIPAQWSITIAGDALLTSRRGNLIGSYTGTGYVTALSNEPDALRAASDAAASYLAAWLDGEAQKWK